MANMNSPAALDKNTLVSLASKTRPGPGTVALVTLITGLAGFVAAAPQKGTLPTLALLGLAVALGLVWWFLLRQPGRRGNDYSPMKTDAELARTPWSWKEEGRALLVLLLIIIPLNLSSFFASWGFAAIFAGLAMIVTWFSIRTQAWRPVHYEVVDKIPEDGALRLRSDAEWMRAFLYANQIVPGGYQLRTDVVAEAVGEYGMNETATKDALNALVANNEAVLIRELRSHDGRVNWVTLTEKGREDFKKSMGLPVMAKL